MVLWPHGVLFRDSEQKFREKMLKDDVIEAVIGLGPNLFYNSPMEACLLICRWDKPKERKEKVLFINAVNEVTRQNAFSYLTDEHVKKIHSAFKGFKDIKGFSKVVGTDEIFTKKSNLSIPRYINIITESKPSIAVKDAVTVWLEKSSDLKDSARSLLAELYNYENN